MTDTADCHSLCYAAHSRGSEQDRCRHCNILARGEGSRRCGICLYHFHLECEGVEFAIAGPWHCRACLTEAKRRGWRDLTLDQPLMHYVCGKGQFKGSPSFGEKEKISRAAQWLFWQDNTLYLIRHGATVEVPPLGERHKIIEHFQSALGFPGGSRLYEYVRARYYWNGMQAHVQRACAEALPNQVEGAKFTQPVYLYPTRKTVGPFHTWAIDSITNLYPEHPEGFKHVVVCVCIFTKWVEAWPAKTLSSRERAQLFHSEITCRFGLPACIRLDRGTEFQGDFLQYCTMMGIRVQLISTANPRANGLVERYNGCIKAGFRKCSVACPHGFWWDFLPDILAGLRQLPTSLGYSPFLAVFKQEAANPYAGCVAAEVDATWPTQEEEEALIQGQILWWDTCVDEIRQKIEARDQKMVQSYQEKLPASTVDVRFQFQPGDLVLVKQKVQGKLQTRATGPHKFLEYLGERRAVAKLQTAAGKTFECSVAQITPCRGDVSAAYKAQMGVKPQKRARLELLPWDRPIPYERSMQPADEDTDFDESDSD